ncbi:hypothetical protein O9993_05080 [Vibrio lentus]|nr:hypothetical protein [Vibrio lentus]
MKLHLSHHLRVTATFTDDATEAASNALDMQGATATALMLLNTVEAITKQMAHPASLWAMLRNKPQPKQSRRHWLKMVVSFLNG